MRKNLITDQDHSIHYIAESIQSDNLRLLDFHAQLFIQRELKRQSELAQRNKQLSSVLEQLHQADIV